MIRTRHGTVYHERRQREMPYIPSQTGPRERPFRVVRPSTGGRGTGCARDEGDGGSAWQAMASSNPRRSNGNARSKLSRRVRSYGGECGICHGMRGPSHYDEPSDHNHPLSFVLDEIHPVRLWRQYGYASKTAAALDPRNVQAAHWICNAEKGGKDDWHPVIARVPIVVSRQR